MEKSNQLNNNLRTVNSIKNAIYSILLSVVTVAIGLVSQKVFVEKLGTEYLGLNGLFNNILYVFSIAELGFGTAIIYNLYKPISEKDEHKINVLLNYYKKVYKIVALIIIIMAVILMPFIPKIVGKTTIENIRLLFAIAMVDTIVSYLLAYKRSILYADQKNYVLNIFHIIYLIVLNIIEIFILIKNGNYMLYLSTRIIFKCLENYCICKYVNKKYKFIHKTTEKLDLETKLDIKTKVKGLLFHNVGGVIISGTDNIIISSLMGLKVVGIYANYSMILIVVENLINQLFKSITSSVGNLLIEENHKNSYLVYKSVLLINSFIYTLMGICLTFGVSDFIKIWMGEKYVLPNLIVTIIVLNFYFQGMRKTNNMFKDAAGIFYEDRFVPIIEATLNIVLSVWLGNKLGLVGVFIGTILSSFVSLFYSYPVLVYKKLFKLNYINFIYDNGKYYALTVVIALICFFVTNKIVISNQYISFVIKMLVCVFTIFISYMVIFWNSREIRYYLTTIKRLKKKEC